VKNNLKDDFCRETKRVFFLLSVPHVGAATGSVDQCLLYATYIHVLPAFGRCDAYVQLIYWLYLHAHAKLHIILETKNSY